MTTALGTTATNTTNRIAEFRRAYGLAEDAAIPRCLQQIADQYVQTGNPSLLSMSQGTAGSEAARLPPAVQSTPGGPGVFRAKTDPVRLSEGQMKELTTKLTTCPFVKSAVENGDLAVRNSAEDPLVSVKETANIGNTGGGDLGLVLELFATGNHTKSLDDDGNLTVETPRGYWSLHLPGSQGAHAGHSGIMMGDPNEVGSGRLDRNAFARLAEMADDEGFLNYDKIGEHIAQNVKRDPEAVAIDVVDAAKDTLSIVREAIDVLQSHGDPQEKRELVRAITERLGSNNLLGGAGEFALMFALVRNQPGKGKGNDKKVRLADLEAMMFEGKFPEGMDDWPKYTMDWLKATAAISAHTIGAYVIGT